MLALILSIISIILGLFINSLLGLVLAIIALIIAKKDEKNKEKYAKTASAISIVAIILSALFLKEPMSVYSVIGAVLVLGATMISELPSKNDK